jgi:two-component system, response regulator PdtaR
LRVGGASLNAKAAKDARRTRRQELARKRARYLSERQLFKRTLVVDADQSGKTLSIPGRLEGLCGCGQTPRMGRGETEQDSSLVVLVVEDEPLVRMTVVDVLRADGITVIEAYDAEQAVSILGDGSTAVDVVFTDVRFPQGRNGFELAQWIRENRPALPVAVTSGHAAYRGTKPRPGPNDLFIEKPCDFDKLPQQLKTLAHGTRQAIP